MIALPDTNAILRYLLNDVPDQYEISRELFENIRTGTTRALILESVMVECVYVLGKYYKIPRNEIAEKLIGLLHYRGIVNKDAEDLINGLVMFAKQNIDIVDCLLSVKSRKENHTLFSFNESLKRIK